MQLFTKSSSRFLSKINKRFSNYIPIHIITNILNEEDIDVVMEEIVNNKD